MSDIKLILGDCFIVMKNIPNMSNHKIFTAKDALNYKGDIYTTVSEASFRRGYFCAIRDIIDTLRDGVLSRQLLAYFNGDLWAWYFNGPHDKIIQAPKLPKFTFGTSQGKFRESWRQISKRILERDSYVCHYCGDFADTTDHEVPLVKGGSDDDDNLVACCKLCNSKKHRKSYEEFCQQSIRDHVVGKQEHNYK